MEGRISEQIRQSKNILIISVSYNLRTVHVEALFEFLNAGLQLGEEFTNGVQPTRIKGGLDYGT
jgi:hypothetical protein